MPGTSNDGGKHGTWRVISSKASFAHAGSVVNNEGGDFVFHFLRTQVGAGGVVEVGGRRGRKRRRAFMRRDAQTVMRYIWQTSSPRGVSAPVVLGSGRLMSQWRRTGAQNLDHERQKAVSASVPGHGHIWQK